MLPEYGDPFDCGYDPGHYSNRGYDRHSRPKVGFLPPGPRSNAYKSGRKGNPKPKKARR